MFFQDISNSNQTKTMASFGTRATDSMSVSKNVDNTATPTPGRYHPYARPSENANQNARPKLQFSTQNADAENKPIHLIGTIDHIFRWYKQIKSSGINAIFEAIGTVEKIDKNRARFAEHLIFLRCVRSDQILQCVFYNTDRELPLITIGTLVAATGKMTGSCKLQIYDIIELGIQYQTIEEAIQRMTFLSQMAVHKVVKD